jgi:hypothetical protein
LFHRKDVFLTEIYEEKIAGKIEQAGAETIPVL